MPTLSKKRPRQPPGGRPAAASAEAWQDHLAAFLQDPASYAHGPAHVEIIQTHASYVALAPPLVFKVKKPVNFGFLDFSTLERRRHFCEQEVLLNRRLCPDVYEGVVPIVERDGRLAFGGEGEVVEYAVRMKQLADGFFLNQLLARGQVRNAHLDRVVEKLRAFYAAETPTAEAAAWGRPERLKISTDENFAQTEGYAGTLLPRPAFDALRYATDRFYDRHARLLSRRRAGGRILDAHGDLHLEHVHITPEAVSIYDCIEFNERLRFIDVANDVAFLAMDLDFNGRPDLADAFVRRMAEALHDPDLPALVDFYKGYRAYVRAKVEGLRSDEPEVPEAERQASRERAGRYFRLALRYAVAGSKPLVVVVMGRVGTGKSTLARALADALGWEVLSSDRTRKERAGLPLFERGSEAQRAELYAQPRTDDTYTALCRGAVERAGRRQGVVLDATYGCRRHREALRQALRRRGIPYCFVEATASDATIRARLRRREHAGREVSDARLEDFDLLAARYQAPDALEEARHVIVATETAAEATTLDALQRLIRLDLWADETSAPLRF